MTLAELAKLLAEASGDRLTPERVLECLFVIRDGAEWSGTEPGWLYEPLAEPVRLTAELQLDDRYMTYSYVGHYPLGILCLHATEATLIAAILDDGGFFNPFTSLMLAVCDGKLRPFTCFYREPSEGGTEHVFDEARRYSIRSPFGRTFEHRRLEWSAHGEKAGFRPFARQAPELRPRRDGLRVRVWRVEMAKRVKASGERFSSELRDLALREYRRHLAGRGLDESLADQAVLRVGAEIEGHRRYTITINRGGPTPSWDSMADTCVLRALEALVGPIATLEGVPRALWSVWPMARPNQAAETDRAPDALPRFAPAMPRVRARRG